MRRLLFTMIISFFGFFIGGCVSSLNIPTQIESRRTITRLQPQLDSLNMILATYSSSLPTGNDLITRTRSSAVNILLTQFSDRSLDDIHIDFSATRPLWKEERFILGMSYTNYVDIDTGSLDVDLKKFIFNKFSNNLIDARIEIEGTGSVKSSGIYAGVWGRVSPQIHFYLDESIQFIVTTANSDYIRLTPVPKTILLKTKISINLLGWSVPYYKEIPLRTTDLIKPLMIPSAVRSEIVFPIPAAYYGGERLEFIKRHLQFSRSTIRAHNNILEYRSDIDFVRE